MSNLTEAKASELVAMYNEAARALGERTVNKFSDRATAVKRTQAILQRAQEGGFTATPKTEEAKVEPKAKATKGERRMSFAFKPASKQKEPKGEASLRTLCRAKLLEGAKFEAVIRLVEKFDSNRGKGNAATIERRAYELVRIMHYQLGYGIKHNEETGLIQLYTN